MTTLRHLLDQQQIGLTIYSPDCTYSRLWGHLDHAIQQAAGLEIVHRQWLRHDVRSVLRFYAGPDEDISETSEEAAQKYQDVPLEKLQYGHLMMQLLLSGPLLLTIWQGPDAIKTLLALKGATHPVQAAPGTIRGGFWCDNAVANLTHSSDDEAECMRELAAVNLSHLWDERPAAYPPMEPVPNVRVMHSGILLLWEALQRVLPVHLPHVPLPASGDAKETHNLFAGLLQETASKLPESEAARLINAYLAGDVITVSRMLDTLPVTQWEYFIIQCGAITYDKWKGADTGPTP